MSRNIMLVESDAPRRAELRSALAEPFTVTETPTCAEALEQLGCASGTVDCVLLSLACEGALDFLAAKRANTALHGVPLIALATPGDEDAELRALELDATDVAYQPIKPALLVQRVRNLLRLSENAALRRALERDPLTGIFSRQTFARRTAKMLRKKQGEIYQLQVWDVEHFKVINDLHGTAVGDRVLRAIARALDEQLRGVGTYARLESDRFALCYPARLYEPGELLDAAAAQLDQLDGGVRVALYAGVYNIDDTALSVEQMCDRAFLALKTVKGRYHERYAYYDADMREQLMLEQRITCEMNLALQDGQFCFYLQPIYSIATGEPTSAEALVRWHHPERGVVPPRDFIPLFERNGFIAKLDMYLWESVCRYQRDLLAEGLTPLPISVNLSRLNLLNPTLCQQLVDTAARYGLPPRLLKLEITESAYTDHPERLLEASRTLREQGFEILMDDFGSGYSSLSMLKDLQVDVLKVDMRFLSDMETNSRAASMMVSIVRMAKWLDTVVVAEGVETYAQVEFLRSIGCDEAQGYYYATPLTQEAFTALLRDPAAMRRPHEQGRERLLGSLDVQSLWQYNQQASVLFGSMIGAIGLFEKAGDTLDVLRVNEAYFELLGTTPQTLLRRDLDPLARMEAADRRKLLSACERSIISHSVDLAQVCCPHADGRVLWLDIRVRHLGSVNGRDLFYFALSDASRQKELERNILLYQYGAAMLDAYDEVLELNYTDALATSFTFGGSGGYHTVTLALEAALRSIATKRVHPEDRERVAALFEPEAVKNATGLDRRRPQAVEVRTHRGEEPYHWTRITARLMDDPSGKLRMLCCSRTIDEQKQNERIQAEYLTLQTKQREQERYRVIFEQTQTALLAWEPLSPLADGNALAGAYNLAGVPFDRLLAGELPQSAAHPDDWAALCALFRGLTQTGNAATVLRLAHADGETPWCKLCATVQRDGEGEVAAVLATVNDVDREQRIQLQLDVHRAENERRLSMLSNLYWTLPCLILQLSMDDPPRPIFYNRACWEHFGYTSKEAFEQAAGADIFRLVAPEGRATLLMQLLRCQREHTAEALDIAVMTPGGARRNLRGSAAVSHGSDGAPMLQLVLLDTTEQCEQELRLAHTRASLQRTTEMLQHLLDNLPVGVLLFEFGSEPRAQFVNTSAYRMFGLAERSPARVLELMRLYAFHVEEAEAGQPVRALDDAGDDMGDTRRVTRADGAPLWLRIHYAIQQQGAAPPLCYAVLVDVTRQVEVERAYSRQSELYRIMMEDSNQIFFDYDLEKDEMHYTLRMPTGHREERVMPSYATSIRHSTVIHPEHIPGFITCIKRCRRSKAPCTHEFMANYFGTGEYRWYRAYYRSIADESGQLYRVVGRILDIQEEKARDAQLGQAKVFRRAVNSVSLFVFAFDLPEMQPHLLSCEEPRRAGFHPYLDYLAADRNESLIHPDEREALMAALDSQNLASHYRAGSHALTIPFRALNRQKNWIWLEMNIHLSAGEGRGGACGIGYVKVIEDWKKLERKASLDGLTQLLNRTTMEERVDRLLADSAEPCCLLMFDVDDFKSVNDRFGHSAGDDLLRQLAATVRGRLRQSDLVGRLGGDEFVALLRNATEDVGREKSAELLSAIEALAVVLPDACPITVSIGFACAPADGIHFETLYNAADRALYTAKRTGKNRVCAYRDCEGGGPPSV